MQLDVFPLFDFTHLRFYAPLHVAVMLSVSVCSTTLWVGQLDKRAQQHDVASLLEEFGPIESINVSENITPHMRNICYLWPRKILTA